MPVALERKLRAEAVKKWPTDKEHQDRYVYGTLQKLKLNKEHGKTLQ